MAMTMVSKLALRVLPLDRDAMHTKHPITVKKQLALLKCEKAKTEATVAAEQNKSWAY